MNTDCLWHYRARITRVVDADTLDLTLDQGLRNYRTERVRLLGVNCPELTGEHRDAGIAAKLFVMQWLGVHPVGTWPLLVRTERADSFGRYLAYVIRLEDGASLTAALIAAGHGVPASETVMRRQNVPPWDLVDDDPNRHQGD